MPIYDYRCEHCGHAFSAVQSYNDPPIDKCPNCGKKPRRLIVPPAIHFRGAGFYKTDNRRADSSESKSEPTKKPEGKPETKGSGEGGPKASGGKSEAAS